MITVYSDGTTISSDYVAAVSQPSIAYSMKLYANGSEVAGTIKRAQIELGAGSADGDYQAFSPVQVLSTQFSATIYNAPNLIGEEIEVRVGVLVDNAYKYVNIAYITITEQSTWQGESEVNGVGRMGLMYAPLGLSAGDYSPSDIATAIVTATGINVAVGGFTASQSVHIESGWTCRDAIESMCARLGGYACEVDGGISILPYSATATYTLPTGFITARPDVKDSYTVNGLTVKADGDSYSYGTGGVTIDDPTATAATSAITWGNMQGYSFNPGTLKVALIDPRVTPADTISYNGWNVPSRGISITYDGGYFGTYAAVGITAEEEEALVEGPLSSKVATAYDIATEARAVAEATGQYFWHDTNGAHVSTDALNPTGASNSLWNSLGLLIRKVANNLVSITQSAIAFFDGNGNNASNITASFGPSGFQIGQDDGSHVIGDYHSLQLVDKEGGALGTYFHVSDLRGTDGTATITDTFVGDGTETRFELTAGADSTDYTVTVNDVEVTSGVTKSKYSVVFTTAPASGDSIAVTYVTSSREAKAFTFGTRKAGNIGSCSAAFGMSAAQGGYSFSANYGSANGSVSSAFGASSANGRYTHAEGSGSRANGAASHAEGLDTQADGDGSHSEGLRTVASGRYSHSEGYMTQATGAYSHAEGGATSPSTNTTASGDFSHAEGSNTTASGQAAHAEGSSSNATAYGAHAEGLGTTASGNYSHAEGNQTTASGIGAHAEGNHTLASSDNQHVVGIYNVEDANGTYLEIVGNGTPNTRSNARTLDTSGNEILAGGLTLGSPLTVANGGTGATSASGARSNLLAVGYATGMNAAIANFTGADQMWGLRAKVINTNNTDYLDHSVYILLRNDGLSAYDTTASTYPWRLKMPTDAVTDLTVSTATPTLSNATAAAFEIRKTSSVVNLQIQQLKVVASLADGYSISLGSGIISSGSRPAHAIGIPLVANVSGKGAGCWLHISTGGNVTLYNRSGSALGTNTSLYGNTTWVV